MSPGRSKKQLSIRRAFGKQRGTNETPEECKELQEEVNRLKLQLAQKQVDLFETMRQELKRNQPPTKQYKTDNTFLKPEIMILDTKKKKLEQEIELYRMLTGTEVASYVEGDHCTVLFHMQHPSAKPIIHGLRLEMGSGTAEVSKYSLPLGFNIEGVVSEYPNIMDPECLGGFHRALIAYYNRLEQYNALIKMVPPEVKVFSAMADSTHIEISMKVNMIGKAQQGHADLTLTLNYRVYDLRAKLLIWKADMSEEDMKDLKKQCSVFKVKNLADAFEECFLSGNHLWQCFTYKHSSLRDTQPAPSKRPKKRRPARNMYEDDPDYSDGNTSAEEYARRLANSWNKHK